MLTTTIHLGIICTELQTRGCSCPNIRLLYICKPHVTGVLFSWRVCIQIPFPTFRHRRRELTASARNYSISGPPPICIRVKVSQMLQSENVFGFLADLCSENMVEHSGFRFSKNGKGSQLRIRLVSCSILEHTRK